MAAGEEDREAPSLSWRMGSSVVTGLTGFITRTFLNVASSYECHGLDDFIRLLEERQDVTGRTKGLITVSNHLSVIDDPFIWGVLPFRFHWNPNSVRWSLGSQDLMFKKRILCNFFSLGQCLPTHRLAHSPYGGLFQPTMTQAIRLLSDHHPQNKPLASAETHNYTIADPFSDPTAPTFHSSPLDPYPYQNPSYYASRRLAWVHIFPEGRIHQHPELLMRYFKWGVARLILESDPAPTLVPLFIEGFDHVMHESREFPRFLPRPGKHVSVTFGRRVETDEGDFGDLRSRWRRLVAEEQRRAEKQGHAHGSATEQPSSALVLAERLKYGAEAIKLREECTLRVRDAVLAVKRLRGYPDEDPKARLVDTWREEGRTGQREGQMPDGSWVKEA